MMPHSSSLQLFSLPKLPADLGLSHINKNRMVPRFSEVQLLLKQDMIHIMMRTETWLSNSQDSSNFRIEGYDFCRYDRSNKKPGGLCCFFNSTNWHVRNDPSLIETLIIEIPPLKSQL